MRKSIFLFIFFLFSFMFIGNINAEGIVSDLKLECKSPVGYNTTFDCDLYGKINDSRNLSNLEVTDSINSRMIKTVNLVNYDVSRMSGNLKLATYTGKTNSTSGNATVVLRVVYNDIYIKYVTYKVRINDNNADLKSLSIDSKNISEFKSNLTSYDITTKNDKVLIGGTARSNKSTIAGLGEKKLECGLNTFTITVKAQSKDEKKYTLRVTKDCDAASEVVLKSVKLSTGNITPKFDSKITDYKVVVGKDVEKISLTGEVDSKLTIEGNLKDKEISPGLNKFTLTVKGKDNTKKEYVFNVIRQKDDAYSSSLSLSSGSFNFDRNTFLYETTVLYNTVNVDVRAVPESQNSKVEVEGGKNLQVGDNTINVKVTSETESVNTYKIKVVRLKEGESIGDNAYIKNIKIQGYSLNFSPDIVNYTLKIKNEKKLNIKVEMEDEQSTYEIQGNKNLKDGSIITIKAISSGGFVKLYKIKISKKSNILFYIVGIIVFLSIIGLVVAVLFFNKNNKGSKNKIPVISSNLLSINKEKNKDKDNRENMLNNGNKNHAVDKRKTSNNNQNVVMNQCPKCGLNVPNTISMCPRCKFRLK